MKANSSAHSHQPLPAPPYRLDVRGSSESTRADLQSVDHDGSQDDWVVEDQDQEFAHHLFVVDSADEQALIDMVQSLGTVFDEWRNCEPETKLEVRGRIVRRALDEANGEGVAWTPLLDTVACRESLRSMIDVRKQLKPLLRWSDAQTNVDAIRPLLRFRYRPLRRYAVRRIFAVERTKAKVILAADPTLLSALYPQPNLRREHHEELTTWAISRILKNQPGC
jgi:hypothetical protein